MAKQAFLSSAHSRGQSQQSGAGHRGGTGNTCAGIRPTAVGTLSREKPLLDAVESLLHRHTVFPSGPETENGKLRIRVVVAEETSSKAIGVELRLELLGIALDRRVEPAEVTSWSLR
jgi:hypothetical protein